MTKWQRPVESMRPGGLPTSARQDAIDEMREFMLENSDPDQVSGKGFPENWFHIPQPSSLHRCGTPGGLEGNIQIWADGCGNTFVSAEAQAEHRKSCTERNSK
jgi:hypothetical protein